MKLKPYVALIVVAVCIPTFFGLQYVMIMHHEERRTERVLKGFDHDGSITRINVDLIDVLIPYIWITTPISSEIMDVVARKTEIVWPHLEIDRCVGVYERNNDYHFIFLLKKRREGASP